jgi:predicted Zn-dependent peptidase
VPTKTKLSGFYVVYGGSTNFEKEGTRGLFHLMEHLMCKSFDYLQDEFENDCIQWNAYTSINYVVFYISGLENKVNKYREKILKSLLSFNHVTEEIIKIEKDIVEQEYYDCFGDYEYAHSLNLDRKLFNYYHPIGELSDIRKADLNTCKTLFKKYFSKPNHIVDISCRHKKEENPSELFGVSTIPVKRIGFTEYHDYIFEEFVQNKTKTSIINVSKPIDKHFKEVTVINNILSSGLNSPFYQEIREKRGLVYGIECYSLRKDKSLINKISASTSNKNVKEFQSVLKMILDDKKKYLTRERFDTVINSFKTKQEIDNINKYVNYEYYISETRKDFTDNIGKIKFDDIYDLFDKYYNFDEYYHSYSNKEWKK